MKHDQKDEDQGLAAFFPSIRESREETRIEGVVPPEEVERSGTETIEMGLSLREEDRRVHGPKNAILGSRRRWPP